MPQPVRVSLSVVTTDPAQLTTVAEHMARTAVGLALDGVECFVSAYPDRDDEHNPPH